MIHLGITKKPITIFNLSYQSRKAVKFKPGLRRDQLEM